MSFDPQQDRLIGDDGEFTIPADELITRNGRKKKQARFRWSSRIVLLAILLALVVVAVALVEVGVDQYEHYVEGVVETKVGVAVDSTHAALVNSLDPIATPVSSGRPQLTFVSNRLDTDSHADQLFLMRANGGVDYAFTDCYHLGLEAPAWSPDGSRVAFVAAGNVYVMDLANQFRYLLTADLGFPGQHIAPGWSPDGSQIAFVSDRDGNAEIYRINVDGSKLLRLTHNEGYDLSPAWSPDGSQIAFVSDRDGNPEIYLMNADGSNPVRLTHDDMTGEYFGPDMSYISRWMPPLEYRGGDEYHRTRFVHRGYDVSPAWSPDGSRIAFVSTRDGNEEIYVIAADGSYTYRLTHNDDYDSQPAWSPDGSQIAFVSDRDTDPSAPTYRHNYDIYLMDRDGGNERRVTDDLSADLFPAWRPYSTLPIQPFPQEQLDRMCVAWAAADDARAIQ